MTLEQLSIIMRRLGFKKHSALVYQTVKTLQSPLVSHIAKASKLHRPALYRSLKELIAAELVSIKKIGRRKRYLAGSENKLIPLFLKDLGNISKLVKNQKEIKKEIVGENLRLMHGASGIRAVFDEIINHTPRGHTFYRYTSEKDLTAVNRYLSPDYRERRDKKHLERLVISNPVSGRLKRPRLERFVKFIPPEADLFDQNIIEIIYEDRVAFIDLDKEEVMIIENQSLADFQKVIFKQLYRRL